MIGAIKKQMGMFYDDKLQEVGNYCYAFEVDIDDICEVIDYDKDNEKKEVSG